MQLNYMIKRKGLVRDTTSLVIAIVGIILLLFAVYQLYNVFVDQDSEVAKRTLNVIEAKINLLDEGQTGKFPIKGPWNKDRKWYLVGWGKENSERPDKCYFDSCICICDGSLKESCQGRNGFCRKVDVKEVRILNEILVKTPPVIGVEGPVPIETGGESRASAIEFPANLIELQIKKNKDSLEIGYTK